MTSPGGGGPSRNHAKVVQQDGGFRYLDILEAERLQGMSDNWTAFEADKDRVIKFYRKSGYLDAELVSDSTWYSEDKKKIDVLLKVHDGPQYKIRSITWEGNTVYKPEVLNERLQFAPGQVYDEEKFEQNLRGNQDQTDVASLYLDNGYLKFYLLPDVKRMRCDTQSVAQPVKGGETGTRR